MLITPLQITPRSPRPSTALTTLATTLLARGGARGGVKHLLLITISAFALSCSAAKDGPVTGPPDPTAIRSLTLSPATTEVSVGVADTLVAEARTASGAIVPNAVITFTHSAPALSTLVISGPRVVITGLASGTDTVTASAQGPYAPVVARAVMTVTPALRQVSFPYHMAVLSPGQTIGLAALTYDPSGKPLGGSAGGAGGSAGGSAVSYAVQPASLGTMTSEGAFVAGSGTGGGTVAASFKGQTDTLRVSVMGGTSELPLALSDTLVREGAALTLGSGSPLAGATVSIGGRGASVASGNPSTTTTTTPNTISVTADAGVFAICSPLGTKTSVSVTTGGASRSVSLALLAPARLALKAGEAATFSGVVPGANCPVALTPGQSYMVMPYTWDQRAVNGYLGSPSSPVPTTNVVVGYRSVSREPAGKGSLSLASLSAASLRNSGFNRGFSSGFNRGFNSGFSSKFHSGFPEIQSDIQGDPRGDPRRVPMLPNRASSRLSSATATSAASYRINPAWYRAVMRTAVVPRAVAELAPPTSGGTCPVPLTLGATVQMGTGRLADGTFLYTASAKGTLTDTSQGDPIETWTLVGIGESVAVFADTALINALPSMPGADLRLQKLAAAYDTAVTPFFARNTGGVADRDGNGRVVVLVAKNGQNGTAYMRGYGRVDCQQPGTQYYGEAIQSIGGVPFFESDAAFRLLAPYLEILVHETAHLTDDEPMFFPTNGFSRKETMWAPEGTAWMTEVIWEYGGDVTAKDVFASNTPKPVRREIEGGLTTLPCQASSRDALTRWYQFGSYLMACQFVRYTFAQAYRLNPAQSLKDLFVAWSLVRDRTSTVAAYNGLTKESLTPREVMRNYLFSWYADDYVPGADPRFTEPSVNMRAWYPSFFGGRPYPLPDAVIGDGGTEEAALVEPDVRFYEATAESVAQAPYLVLSGPGGSPLPTAQVDIGILRVR